LEIHIHLLTVLMFLDGNCRGKYHNGRITYKRK
jgi:hypothetical protein